MLILLPPSETKRPGGVGISIDRLAIIWAALDPARDTLIDALNALCLEPEKAAKVLKLGKRNLGDLLANQELRAAPTMPAIERYTGVLFEALGYQSLSQTGKHRAGEKLFIQSSLFGLLPATEQIPYYRFSATTKLPGIDLKKHWIAAHAAVWPRMIGPILDLRSKAYVELNPIPAGREAYFVEVLDPDGRALNHFNKKAKGLLVRAALQSSLEEVSELPKIAKTAGLHAELDGQSVRLIVPKAF